MGSIKVWTKQNENVLRELESKGRYTAKREYIIKDLDEHANLVLEVYDWLVRNSPGAFQKPADAHYPIWVSMEREATMLPSQGTVIIELTVDPDIITRVNIDKWGTILNYSYPFRRAGQDKAQKIPGAVWNKRCAGIYVTVLSAYKEKYN